MAVTALSKWAAVVLCALLASGTPMLADRAADIRSQLGVVATSLGAGNPSDALSPFDKSYPGYEKLSGYFQALSALQVENEVDVTDEEDAEDSAKVTITWAVTLTDLVENRTDRRTAEINARLVLRRGKWKIVEFSPIDIFNPLPKWAAKR